VRASVAVALLLAAGTVAATARGAPPVPPEKVVRDVRAAGLRPLGDPIRQGQLYVLSALNPRGDRIQVVVSAVDGDIISVQAAKPPSSRVTWPSGPIINRREDWIARTPPAVEAPPKSPPLVLSPPLRPRAQPSAAVAAAAVPAAAPPAVPVAAMQADRTGTVRLAALPAWPVGLPEPDFDAPDIRQGAALPAGPADDRPPVAEPYPGSRAIELTVMSGSVSADEIAQLLAEGLSARLGTAVPVVDHREGGDALGAATAPLPAPNGYAIFLSSSAISTSDRAGGLPAGFAAFAPVARISVENPAIAVRADAPWRSLTELIDYAKANPGRLRIGNSGTGSLSHYAAATLITAAGARATDLPLTPAEAMVKLLGGHIEAVVQFPAALMPQVRSGELRVLAVLGSAHDPAYPEVPTAVEAGLPQTVNLEKWRGVMVPKGTPAGVVERLQDALRQVVESEAFAEAGRSAGFVPAFLAAGPFGERIAADDRRLAEAMAGSR
jgi:tripartite-type tricarboxylate transporter receptor subunit TctC